MSSDRIVISGATGGVAERQEINDFITNDKLFTLYIRALQAAQAADEAKDASFFGISGIHGEPFVSWNGAVGDFAPGKWDFGGYCTHGSPLFPTWHRPYVLLLEQTLQRAALQAAQQFQVNRADWQSAATKFRLPFWDWAKNSVPPDVVINSPNVTITDFDGSQTQVDNPLMRYRFQGALPFTPPWNQFTTTVRHPDGDGNENIAELKSALADGQEQTTDDTIALLHMVHDWPGFSNHRDSAGSVTSSLETIHDQIHVEVGGNGQMSDPSVAAFDPIFYLHHCNVDRLVSIWSALNHNVVVTREVNDQAGTFTASPDTMVDETTDLTPFWDSNDTFWKSQKLFDAKKRYYNTDKLGYVYPAFSDVDRNDHKSMQQAAKKVIHRLLAKPQDSIFKGNPSVPKWYNWSVRIRVRKFELGRSFTVLVFLGKVPENPAEWYTCKEMVGRNHVFANSAPGNCENCRRQSNIIHEGFVHLNRGFARLAPQVRLPCAPDVVVPYLKENLNWRVIDTARQPVEIHSLDVTALAVTLTTDPSSPLPKVGEREIYHDVTAGRHNH